MAESSPSPTGFKPTLGLTGLTSNAMALIAPGALMWLTYSMQSQYGKPIAAISMWFGIVIALLLCLATAVAYAELSKLYPGAGSSYFFAEQAFLSKKKALKWARIAKFMVGWASHLYYWVYPGVMVALTTMVVGYMAGYIFPKTFNASLPSPLFMMLFCVMFSFGIAYIAFRGVGIATAVNVAINVVQITALVIFSVMAIRYRAVHPEGAPGVVLIADSDGNNHAYDRNQAKDEKGKLLFNDDGTPKLDPNGIPTVSYFGPSGTGGVHPGDDPTDQRTGTKRQVPTFDDHTTAGSVVAPHNFNFIIVQVCVAILLLVGFESVTSMGEEAKNAKRDIPKAIILSLVIQGGFCYMLQYFAANYFLHNNYPSTTAALSAAPIGDMMQMVGFWAFGSTQAGYWFMMVQATTVVLALIGTTLSSMSTGARVTYAMGRDEELGAHFGILHGKNLTPHRAIWALAIISTIVGMFAVLLNFCGPGAASNDTVASVWHKNIWYMFGLMKNETASAVPQGMLVVTLISNFGTFLLYMMTCIVAIVAFREHHTFHGFKHMVVPVFGLLANLLCMLFYLIGPFSVAGMSWSEPYCALAAVALWGIWGAIYFIVRSRKRCKPAFLTAPPTASVTLIG